MPPSRPVPSAASAPMSGPAVNLLFLMRSGIRDGSLGLRIDCGSALAGGGSALPNMLPPSDALFVTQEGFFDPEPDQVWIDQQLNFVETEGVDSLLLDGTIPSLLQLFPQPD
jgi:hypothetical protein